MSKSLGTFNVTGLRFVIKTDRSIPNWSRVCNTRFVKVLNNTFADNKHLAFHEFCLGSFDNQYFLNVLVRHEENVEIPECRLVFTVAIRNSFLSDFFFIIPCYLLLLFFYYASILQLLGFNTVLSIHMFKLNYFHH